MLPLLGNWKWLIAVDKSKFTFTEVLEKTHLAV